MFINMFKDHLMILIIEVFSLQNLKTILEFLFYKSINSMKNMG